MIRIKRAYEAAARDDGRRILVDRLWPRGLRRDEFTMDEWMKDPGPSHELRNGSAIVRDGEKRCQKTVSGTVFKNGS